jgi:hypothetical protein
LLLQRRVLLVVRTHRVDRLVERLLHERAHERAVDVLVARVDVPALSDSLGTDLADESPSPSDTYADVSSTSASASCSAVGCLVETDGVDGLRDFAIG